MYRTKGENTCEDPCLFRGYNIYFNHSRHGCRPAATNWPEYTGIRHALELLGGATWSGKRLAGTYCAYIQLAIQKTTKYLYVPSMGRIAAFTIGGMVASPVLDHAVKRGPVNPTVLVSVHLGRLEEATGMDRFIIILAFHLGKSIQISGNFTHHSLTHSPSFTLVSPN